MHTKKTHMGQKEIFDRIYQIILLRGSERAKNAIDLMYDSYISVHGENSSEFENVTYVKNELLTAIQETQEYKNDRIFNGLTSSDRDFLERQKIDKSLLRQDLSSVINKDTIFYNKKVVLTGVFSQYPVRSELAEKIQKLGADINTSISKKTEIVCLGWDGVGPAKMEKIKILQASGYDIQLIAEDELYDNLKCCE